MQVSIVIPNYNGLVVLQQHLPAVLRCMRKEDELIVVDDASNDDSVSFLKHTYPQIQVIEHARNTRFGQACNDGVAQAKHKLVLLLNNDVSPTPDLIKHLLPHFEDSKVVAVGCCETNSAGVLSGKSVASFTRGMFVHARARKQTSGYTMWATAGSMMVRKSVWEKLGGMDQIFRPAYFEDIDLGYRMWKAGYIVKFDDKAQVFHDHETTNVSAFGSDQIQIMSYKNSFIFMWKNVTDSSVFLSHILWLPYHLIVGGCRSHGLLILGFIQAILQMGEVAISRIKVSKLMILHDKEVISQLREFQMEMRGEKE